MLKNIPVRESSYMRPTYRRRIKFVYLPTMQNGLQWLSEPDRSAPEEHRPRIKFARDNISLIIYN